MPDVRNSTIQDLFLRALEVPQEHRDAWLDRACGENRELFCEVRELLDADDPSCDPLEAGVAGIVAKEMFSASCPQCQTQWKIRGLPQTLRCPTCDEQFIRATDGCMTLNSNSGHAPAVYQRGSGLSTFEMGPGTKSPAGFQFGEYDIIEPIAEGGMGVVYKARQTKLNRDVAVKMIKSGTLAGQKQVERFYSEAQAAAKLDHPGIVPVYEVGVQNDQHFYSMAFIEGTSLQKTVKDAGPLPPKRAATLMKSVAEAVQFGHEKGIIHRDIKPHNVLLDESASPRVTDFGLAKHGDSEMTIAGELMGTPSYMPPEQAEGKHDEVGAAADVYSLGATLYYVLTGRPPFQAATPAETLRQVIENDPVPPRRLNLDIPRDLETICLKCLRKERTSRYSTAAAMAADLGRWLENKPIVARRVSTIERTWLWCKRKPVVVGSIVTILVVITVGSLVARAQNNRTRAEELVVGLMKAEIDKVPTIVEQLHDYRQWADPILRQQFGESQEGSDERLHLSLALLPVDEQQVGNLQAHLLAANPAELPVIRDALQPYRDKIAKRLWVVLESNKQKPEVRFNAACALATFDGDNKARWEPVLPFVAGQLVTEIGNNLGDTGRFLNTLKPIGTQLVQPMSRVLRNQNRTELQQDIALNIVLTYATDDLHRLTEILANAEQRQIDRVLNALKPLQGADRQLAAVLRESWTEETPENEKERIAKRQANAAVALLKLEKPAAVWPLLKHSSDPRTRSYIIHWAAPLGVDPAMLIKRIETEPEVSIRRALVLALGEFNKNQLPVEQRQPLIKNLLAVYEHDPDPGMHGCVEWLLTQWGHGKSIKELVRNLQTNEKQLKAQLKDSPRRWYVNAVGQTFTVLKAGVIRMGSPASEADRNEAREAQRLRKIGRTFAISAHEVKKAQFRQFQLENRMIGRINIEKYSRTNDSPQVAVSWYEAAAYCNWLSEREGIPKDQWCYETNANGRYAAGMKVRQSHLELTGYRLPTEPEWEYACRAGTTTSRHYGASESILPKYARYEVNSGTHTWPAASLKPNGFGLFDMHGNVAEWCHDRYKSKVPSHEKPATPGGVNIDLVSASEICLLRGGSSVHRSKALRSAYCYFGPPSSRNSFIGFRVARTCRLSDETPMPHHTR